MANQSSNPRNPESTLFRRLTRLFSGPITNYRSQMTRDYKRSQLDHYASRFKTASGQQFKRSGYNPFEQINASAMANQRRSERYGDFDQMEYTPEIASALDIYADEMTTHSSLQPMLTIKCPNEEIKAILATLYQNVLNIEYNLFGWCRTMCKYGDYFLYLDIDEGHGVKTVIGLPAGEVERLEGEDKTNPNYVQFQWNSAGMTFENWQMAHFRILGNDKYTPYGTSVLEPARRIWRQLTLMEDAMMAYRVVRAPDRRVFYIDVGNIPAPDVEQYMQKVMTSMKRNQLVDPSTGRVDLRYNPMSVEEDYYIPVRGDSSTKIENLAGGQNAAAIDDVKYLRDKLFSALKIPASYLTQGEAGTEDKTTLAQKDIRFARTIQRLQRAAISELEKIGVIHLYTLGFRGDDLLNFSLYLNNPSKLAELQELEHWKTKFEIASTATEGYFSRRWIAEHLFNLTQDEFLRNQREIFYDRKYDSQLASAAEQSAQAETAFASATSTGLGGISDLAGGGGEDLAAEITPEGDVETAAEAPATPPTEAGAETPAPEGQESALLAVPGKRDISEKDNREKGGTGPDNRKRRSTRRGMEFSTRTIFPGGYGSTGMNQLRQNENKGSNYEEKEMLLEEKLLKAPYEVQAIIDSLESKESKK